MQIPDEIKQASILILAWMSENNIQLNQDFDNPQARYKAAREVGTITSVRTWAGCRTKQVYGADYDRIIDTHLARKRHNLRDSLEFINKNI